MIRGGRAPTETGPDSDGGRDEQHQRAGHESDFAGSTTGSNVVASAVVVRLDLLQLKHLHKHTIKHPTGKRFSKKAVSRVK